MYEPKKPLSKYARKITLQRQGLYPRFGQFDEDEETEPETILETPNQGIIIPKPGIIIPEPEIINAEYNEVLIKYLPNPRAIKLISKACPRKLYSLVAKPSNRHLFSVIESGYPHKGRGQIAKRNKFNQLYGVDWMGDQGRRELASFEYALRERLSKIENHLETGLGLR